MPAQLQLKKASRHKKINTLWASLSCRAELFFCSFGVEFSEKLSKIIFVDQSVQLFCIDKSAQYKLRKLTSRSQGRKLDTVFNNIKVFMRGWLNYYGISDIKTLMER